jgi:hypothetical protein
LLFAEIAAKYKSPFTPVKLADVDTVVELEDPPVFTSANVISPLGGGLSTPLPVKLTSFGSSSASLVSKRSVALFDPVLVGVKLTATFRL